MKLLHVADLHQGLQTWSWPDPATGIPSRILDVAAAWRWACERAIEHDVDALVVAGDVFHHPNPDATSLALFAQGLQLLRWEVPVLIIPGNHDRAPHPGRPSVLEAFHLDEEIVTDEISRGRRTGGVQVVTRPGVVEVNGILFACLPSVSRHQLMGGAERLVLQADEDLVEGLRRIVAALASGPGGDVLVGHWSVAGSVLGGETDIAITEEPMLDPVDLEGPWSYVAFGHIHRAQEIGTLGAYAGSIDRMNFGEENYTPGVWLVELDSNPSPEATAKFLPSPARRFITLDVEADGNDVDVEGAIVRVRNVPERSTAEVRASLRAAGAALVRLEVAREDRPPTRVAAAAEVPGPLEALDLYLAQRDVDEDRRPRIRERARELVEAST